jgi:hypothetical protein
MICTPVSEAMERRPTPRATKYTPLLNSSFSTVLFVPRRWPAFKNQGGRITLLTNIDESRWCAKLDLCRACYLSSWARLSGTWTPAWGPLLLFKDAVHTKYSTEDIHCARRLKKEGRVVIIWPPSYTPSSERSQHDLTTITVVSTRARKHESLPFYTETYQVQVSKSQEEEKPSRGQHTISATVFAYDRPRFIPSEQRLFLWSTFILPRLAAHPPQFLQSMASMIWLPLWECRPPRHITVTTHQSAG